MLEVALEGTTRLDSIGRRLREATAKKMEELTNALYEKVIENIEGKILQSRTGELAKSVYKDVEITGDEYFGRVYISPVTDKAWVLEKGGQDYYPIVATKAQMLHFFTKSGEEIFTKSVNHPPSRAFGYMQRALEELVPAIPLGFQEYIQAALDGEG